MSENVRTIDKYQIERRLGSGGFATVWLCYDPALDARVAIKVLGDIWCSDEDVEQRFLQEARLLFQLNDPRVVKVYTTGEREDGCPYFVMDYADRGSLAERIEERANANEPYSPREALQLSRQIADCLSVVHAAGFIHRDLKPSNVLYRSDSSAPHGERMMLGDFGVARPADAASPNTIVAGSPHYMAPEQAEEATAGSVDQRADIYSAAVILYELLAGRVPYPYATVSEIRRAQLANERIPLAQLRANIPSAVIWLVDQGLQTNAVDRPPTVEAWISALDTALASLDDSAPSAAAAAANLSPDDTIPAVPVVERAPVPETTAPGQSEAPADPAMTLRGAEAVQADESPATEPLPQVAAPPSPQEAPPVAAPAQGRPITPEPASRPAARVPAAPPIQPELEPPGKGRRWLRWLLVLLLLALIVAGALAASSYYYDWPANVSW